MSDDEARAWDAYAAAHAAATCRTIHADDVAASAAARFADALLAERRKRTTHPRTDEKET